MDPPDFMDGLKRIPWRRFFALLAMALAAAIAWRVFSRFLGPAFEFRFASLGLPVLEAMARDGVTYFRDQDWCRVLTDREGRFANTPRSTCAIHADEKDVKPLEGEALRRWHAWSRRVGTLPYGVVAIALRAGPEGDLHHAQLSLSSLLG